METVGRMWRAQEWHEQRVSSEWGEWREVGGVAEPAGYDGRTERA